MSETPSPLRKLFIAVTHWEGQVIMGTSIFMVVFTILFFFFVVGPFLSLFPPPSATGFSVSANVSETNYTIDCETGYPPKWKENFSCTYEIAEPFSTDEPILAAEWTGQKGSSRTNWKDSYTFTFFRPVGNETGTTSVSGPPVNDKYELSIEARPNIQDHQAKLTINGDYGYFRIFKDLQAESVIFRALVLTFNIIALISAYAGVGKLNLFLYERVEEKEDWDHWAT